MVITTTIQLTFFTAEPAPLPDIYTEVIGVFGLLVNLGAILWLLVLVVKHSTGLLAKLLHAARSWIGLGQTPQQQPQVAECNEPPFEAAKGWCRCWTRRGEATEAAASNAVTELNVEERT